MGGMVKAVEGWTNKFIFEPYDFSVANAFVTNFHLPYSTQLMMVSAFTNHEMIRSGMRSQRVRIWYLW